MPSTPPWPILLLVRQLTIGGAERDAAKLARYLDRSRFEPHIACFHAEGERLEELQKAGVPILALPVRSFHNWTAVRGARLLRRYIREHGIVLMQAFDAPTSVFAVPLGRLFRVPAVIGSHLFFRHLIPPPQYQALAVVDRLAHRIVVNAHAVERHLIEDHHVGKERIFVSHNGVETSVFHPGPPGMRPPFFADASLIVGTVCVLREEKRLDLLLRAFSGVRHLDPRMKLLIVGSGEMLAAWLALRRELGLEECCHFEPASADVARWMRLMDIFVLPSRSEGFPNALLEAMACGCAVIGSAAGGIPELIDDGRDGFLFPPGDADQLAGRLSTLITGAELRRRMGSEAAAKARTRFSMEIAAARMERFYESLLLSR